MRLPFLGSLQSRLALHARVGVGYATRDLRAMDQPWLGEHDQVVGLPESGWESSPKSCGWINSNLLSIAGITDLH